MRNEGEARDSSLVVVPVTGSGSEVVAVVLLRERCQQGVDQNVQMARYLGGGQIEEIGDRLCGGGAGASGRERR